MTNYSLTERGGEREEGWLTSSDTSNIKYFCYEANKQQKIDAKMLPYCIWNE